MALSLPANPNLVADIGGTNTRVALADGAQLIPGTVERFRNAEHPGLEPILGAYLKARGVADCNGACVAVAGPVQGNRAELTNLAWTMDTQSIAKATGAQHVALLNDLQAQGHAIGHIAAENLVPVIEASAGPDRAAALVIGAGTGFNAAPVYYTQGGRFVPPAEAGHVALPARGPGMRAFVQWLEASLGFASVEEALAGRGLENLYAHFADQAGSKTRLDAASVVQGHKDGTDPVAFEAVRLHVQILGMVTANLALQNLPFGGIYLIGGVARAVSPWFDEFGFTASFRDMGRFSDFMKAFSVYLVADDYAALTGCAGHLAEVMDG